MKSSPKTTGKTPKRRSRGADVWLKAFVWVLLAIFVVTSVGIALVVTTTR